MKTEKLYTLQGQSNEPFYVGHTNRALSKRLKEHLAEAHVFDTAKCRHIKLLEAFGEVITIKLLDEVPEDDLGDTERYYIEELTAVGFTLMNSNEGNSGMLSPTEMTKLRKTIQETKRIIKSKKHCLKMGFNDTLIGPADPKEVERLMKLYDEDKPAYDLEYQQHLKELTK